MCNFVDISEHNTILSFNAMCDSGLKGVIMKATEGTTFIDRTVELSYDALNGRVPIGFYHYLTSTSSPTTQAQNFWNVISNKHYDILPVLDIEHDSLGNNAESYANEFIDEFRRLSGQEMIIYSGRCYIEEHFSYIFKKSHPWWVADYSANEAPSINGCNVIAWQFSEDYKSYAFAMGNLDCSILIDENHFYLSNFVPFSDDSQTEPDSDMSSLQSELNYQGFRDMNGNSLIVDGIAGELTLSACPTLQVGAQGNITAWVQSKVGTDNDGIFGEGTRQAVIVYQENMSLDGDGIVGQNTWRKLLGM
jgi:hypothetical protein